MLKDRKGQGFVEYVVLLAALLAIAYIVVDTIGDIGNVFTRQRSRINSLP